MTRPVFTHMKRHRLGVFFRLAVVPVVFIPTSATAQNVIQLDPVEMNIGAHYSYEQGDFLGAKIRFEDSWSITSRHRSMMFRYGISLVRLGRPNDAVPILEQVAHGEGARDYSIESVWDKGLSRSETNRLIAEAFFQLGIIHQNNKSWDAALDCFERASNSEESDWRAPYAIASLLLNHWKDPQQALDYANRALDRSRHRVGTKNLIANCHNTIGAQRDQAGDEAGALAAFNEALRWWPGWKLVQRNIKVIGARKAAREVLASVQADEARREVETVARPPQPDLPFDLWSRFRELLFESTSPEEVAAMLKVEPRLALKRDYQEQTTLHMARTREIAQLLLDAGADPTIKDDRGGGALFGAMTKDGPDVAMLLAKNGGDLFECDNENRTLLHEAVSVFWGSTETIAWLLAQTQGGGGLVDKKDKSGITPLMLAPETWDQRVADLLLAYGADLDLKDAGGKTAADHAAVVTDRPEIESALRKLAEFGPKPRDYVVAAAERGDIEALKTVLALAPGLVDSVSNEGKPVISIAAVSGSEELLAFLIQAGARLDEGGTVALADAAIAGRPGAVRTLLAAGVDARGRNQYGTPVFEQLFEGPADLECVKAMIDAGADIHGSANQPLISAAASGNAEIVRLLLSLGANPKPENPENSPLLYANSECTKILIEAGADVNARGTNGTPLDDAASKGDLERLKLLVEHGADVKAVDEAGGNALHFATAADCAALLIDKGADVNLRDNEGRTPLHAAVGYETTDTMKLFVERGADINAVDSYGRSPLFGLDAERTRILLEHGANPNIKDNDGKTPLDLALESVRTNEEKFPQYPDWAAKPREVADLLTQAGAKSGADL